MISHCLKLRTVLYNKEATIENRTHSIFLIFQAIFCKRNTVNIKPSIVDSQCWMVPILDEHSTLCGKIFIKSVNYSSISLKYQSTNGSWWMKLATMITSLSTTSALFWGRLTNTSRSLTAILSFVSPKSVNQIFDDLSCIKISYDNLKSVH